MTIFQRFSQIGRFSAKWSFMLATRGAVPAMVCLLMLAAAAVAGAQTTYWVSPSGSDTNPGTYSEPFLTFQAAADAAQTPGDTVIFMDGTYSMGCNTTTSFWDPPSFSTTQGWEYGSTATGGPTCDEAVVLDNQGTVSQPITFMAQHRGKAILDGEAGSGWIETNGKWTCPGADSYILFYNAQNVVVQGFTIQNTCATAATDNFVGSFTNATSSTLTTQGAQNITLRWNDISNVGVNLPTSVGHASGFYCGGNAPSSITDAGIPDPGAEGVVIDGNSIHDIVPDPSVGSWLSHALYINCPDVTITNNIFYNVDNGYDITVAGVEKTSLEGTENVLIANNTFGPTDPDGANLHNDSNNLYSEIVLGSIIGELNGVTIQNNIFYNYRPGGSVLNAIGGENPDVYNCVLDANIVTSSTGLYALHAGVTGQGCTQINEPSTLLDTGSGVMSAPDSPATGGYDLVSGSVAIDNGDFLAPPATTAITVYYPTPYLPGFAFGSADFAKRCRPQGTVGGAYTNSGIDIGAYQYPQTCE